MRRARLTLLALAVAASSATAALGAPAPAPTPASASEVPARWLLTGPIRDPRSAHAAVSLADGRVLVCGGQSSTAAKLLDRCETWTPETERWAPAGSLAFARAGLVGVRLADDRVAFVGGYNNAAEGSPQGPAYAIDVWDPRRNDTVTAGFLPFPAEHPLAVRLPDGRLFIIDDGQDTKKPRAAIWNPADGKSSMEAMPSEAGASVALLVDAHGTLTLVRNVGGHQTSIWRRGAEERSREGAKQGWVLAHSEPSLGGVVGAIALDDHQIIFWAMNSNPAAMLWNASTGASRSVDVPRPERHEYLVALGADRLLAVGWGNSHLYEPGRGWRPTGNSGAGYGHTFTLVRDGRVLAISPVDARVWTPSTFSPTASSASSPTDRACAHLIAQLRGAAERPSSYRPQPTRDNVDPICWAAIAADPSLEASRELKALAQGPAGDGRRQAIQMLCDARAPWAVDVMIRGLAPGVAYNDGPSCLAALAESDQPAARQAVDAYVQDCLRGDRAANVLAEASRASERLRSRAAAVLVVAWHERRPGFDQLQGAVCQPPIPGTAKEVCRKAETNQESEWRQQSRRNHAWLMSGAVTALGAGLVVGATAAQNDDLGRALAIASGALGGGAMFVAPFMGDHATGPLSGLQDMFEGCLAVTGGILGVTAAALTTGDPGASRPVVSALGATLFTAVSLAAIWNF